MPPDRDIDFCTDLELGAHPILIQPYPMDLEKSRELNAQIKELISEGFIHPRASP